MHVEDINVQSRYGSGVRVMRLGEGDRVVTVARTEHSDEERPQSPRTTAPRRSFPPKSWRLWRLRKRRMPPAKRTRRGGRRVSFPLRQKGARLKSSRSKEPSPGRGKNKDGRVAF